MTIDKQNVSVDEKIEIKCIIDKAYRNNETNFIFYLEDYPEDFWIKKGKKYDNLTNDKYLCIVPDLEKESEGIVELQISFKLLGEYNIKINGCTSNLQKLGKIWNENLYIYKFIVNE